MRSELGKRTNSAEAGSQGVQMKYIDVEWLHEFPEQPTR